ncbi:unnamed protein product [Aphanomyces euteiches]|nr:hypothetical protein AeRB84_015957 [Aphanomyces euteiches]
MLSGSKLLVAVAALSLILTPSTDANPLMAAKKLKCKKLVHVCEDGVTRVRPNPYNGCEFDLCPEDLDDDERDKGRNDDDDDDDDDDDAEDEPVKCKKVVRTCADGFTKVHPNPLNDCEFDPCPEEDEDEDTDDLSIADIIDEPATTVAPVPVDANQTDAISNATEAPKTVLWKAIDEKKAPPAVQEAVQLAFGLYNTTQICDKLVLFYDSIEAHNETTPLDKTKKTHAKKSKTASFHLVVNLECYKQGTKQVGGKFILNLEQHGANEAQTYQLIECAHLEAWGELNNWLAVRNNEGFCETPEQKKKFDLQPLQYVGYHPKELTLFDTVIRNKNYLAIVAVSVGAVAALILLCVFLTIQARYCGYKKLDMNGPGPDSAADDEIEIGVRLTPPNKKDIIDGPDGEKEGKFV